MSGAFLVVGTGTDVGKTYVSAAILAAARAGERRALASKPVMSGFAEDDLAASDAGRLLAALGRAPDADAVAEIAPWRFAAPLAPTAAARAAGASLPYAAVLEFCRDRLARPCDLHLIETAGGIMSPIAESALCVDLAADLGLPVLLVAGAYLGAVSHTLTALEAIERRGLSIAAVVVNEAPPAALGADAVISELTPFASGRPLIALRRAGPVPPAALMRALGASWSAARSG